MALNFLEVPVGRKSSTPAIVKHLVRFGRRLREHHIHEGVFPSFVNDDASSIVIRIGRRIVNVHNNGDFNASMREVDGVTDRRAWLAHLNRSHALWMSMAADSRRRGWFKTARADLNIATSDRKLADYD